MDIATTNLTVVCLWIKGRQKRSYTVKYVERLRNMVARHLTIPHRFVCMTDTTEMLPNGIEGIRVKRPFIIKPWWLKLKLFKPNMGWTGRILYIDLDVLIVGSLDEIATFPAPFALLPDMAPDFKGNTKAPHLKIVHAYNSSVMVLDAGARDEVWTDFDPVAHPQRLRSDQDWIGERLPNEATFPREWFERLTYVKPPFDPALKVALAIKVKNAKAEKTLPWFSEYWR